MESYFVFGIDCEKKITQLIKTKSLKLLDAELEIFSKYCGFDHYRAVCSIVSQMIECGSEDILTLAIKHFPTLVEHYNILNMIKENVEWAEYLWKNNIGTIYFEVSKSYTYKQLLFIFYHKCIPNFSNENSATRRISQLAKLAKLWMPEQHDQFPPSFKIIIRTFILICKRLEKIFAIPPRPIKHMIINLILTED